MGYIPIFMQAAGARCLVVGGGEVAQRKAQALLEAGAEVTVVSPTLTAALHDRVRSGDIRHISRTYATGDMRDHTLVFGATDDPILHQALYDEARSLSIPINIADEPERCSFIMPAIVRRGALTIAVSSGGASPSMAKKIADRIGRLFGPEYGIALEILRAARVWLKANENSAVTRSRALSALAAAGLAAMVRKGDGAAIERVLRRHLGAGLEEIGLGPMQSGETQAAR